MSESGSVVRWRPVRAGIRNIWEYDDQIFEFAGGRLVLRGPNGSGKSNALALLVPFLLDGVMAANRMDSLSGGRSMKTLLLCLADDERGGRFRHDQRTGYAWLEFARDGDYCTIGCGARASTQRDAEAWFFVTDQRPGIDLELAPGGVPLSRSALAETIGAGAVHDSAEAYRVAVDETLFALGPHRYRNLVELLLVLRRPHLAGKLNLDLLSKVLSDGLAGLDEQLLADVAASFEDLQAVRRDLQQLQDAHRSVQVFLPVYRQYLRAVARGRALEASEATAALRAARRRVADADKAVEAADAAAEQIRLDRVACDDDRQVAEQRLRAVLESPAYRDAKSFADVEDRAADAEGQLGQAEDRRRQAAAEAQQAAEALAGSSAAIARAATELDSTFVAAAEAADAAGVAWTQGRDQIHDASLAQALRGLGVQRRQDVADVRRALARAERAGALASAAVDAAAAASEVAEVAEAERSAAADALQVARDDLAGELERWVQLSGLDELEVVVALAGVVGDAGAPTLDEVLADALRPRLQVLAAAGARAEDRAASLSIEAGDLAAERRRVADDPVPAPDRLPVRPADRSGRTGAPLYACCDFADHVPEADRAGIEAALEAAGLLDAWIDGVGDLDGGADGSVISGPAAGPPDVGPDGAGVLDAWLRPSGAVASPSLAEVLVPTPPDGSALHPDRVGAVLRSIALHEAGVAVLPDGRFHLGPLSGRFVKAEAGFIGATAREARRRLLLDDLDSKIAEVESQLAQVEAEQSRIAAEHRRLEQVRESQPAVAGVLHARDGLISAVAASQSARRGAERAGSEARQARAVADGLADDLRTLAAERRMAADGDALDHVEGLVNAFEQRSGELVRAAGVLAERQSAHRQAEERSARANRDLAGCQDQCEQLHRQAAGLRARANQLRSQLGADTEAPLRELQAIEAELAGLRSRSAQLSSQASEAAELRGRTRHEQSVAAAAVADIESAAADRQAALQMLRRDDVWPMLGIDTTAPAEPAALAAAVLAATEAGSGEADDNALQRSYRQLLDELARGYDPSLSYVDHVAVVDVTSETGTHSVLWLADRLGQQIDRQQELLSERDRDIFERHLLTRVAHALRDLINDADDLVARMNRSLADRPTASGKSVQLRWELESADPTVRGALSLLRKTPELLGPDERDELRRFFATAIAQRRAEDSAAGYADILRQALDYRAWHGFVPYVRSAGGGVQRLTRTLFRSLSGGEQAVVLHLPLFAAAAAHYDAASVGAPRLIALDEAFAGIDEGMRAELMGLLVRFDLDIVLTGHELWGAYQQVPALMAYDLLRQPPLVGVSAFAVRWDGSIMAEV